MKLDGFTSSSFTSVSPNCADGAAGALCGGDEARQIPPVAVIYDEIDAHLGGRAAVAMAKMLSEQSGQIISITHSPSVAAAAKTHLVVQKSAIDDKHAVQVTRADFEKRRKELARMASGDLASSEAERFADALLRNGLSMRKKVSEKI